MKIIKKAELVNELLTKEFPQVETPLIHSSAYELLIATILSAQTPDVTTNKVTPELFKKYPDVASLSKADLSEVTEIIRRVNYNKTKARNLIKTANIIICNFNSEVPYTMDELTSLRGVGRKVANVVISEWFVRRTDFVEPVGFVVDTHVKRVSYRLGLTKNTDPVKIEKDLMKTFPKENWVEVSLRFIFHGRKTCKSQNPACESCPLRDICPQIGLEKSKEIKRIKVSKENK